MSARAARRRRSRRRDRARWSRISQPAMTAGWHCSRPPTSRQVQRVVEAVGMQHQDRVLRPLVVRPCRRRICRPTVPCCDSSERSPMPEISRPAMLPAPQNSHRAGFGIEVATATAAPRVLRSASWASVEQLRWGRRRAAPRRRRARRRPPRRPRARGRGRRRPSPTPGRASRTERPRVAADRFAGRRQADAAPTIEARRATDAAPSARFGTARGRRSTVPLPTSREHRELVGQALAPRRARCPACRRSSSRPPGSVRRRPCRGRGRATAPRRRLALAVVADRDQQAPAGRMARPGWCRAR